MKINEEWRDVPGYEGLYQVSNLGRVKNRNNQELKPMLRGNYLSVNLWKDGIDRHYNIHRLVAVCFIPNPQNDPVVNHKDKNTSNNSVDNLEWCTQKYNVGYSNNKKVAQFDLSGNLVRVFNSVNDACDFFNKPKNSSIPKAARGELKTAYGYAWRYI